MSTTLAHTCPAWCRLPADHDADDVRGGDAAIHKAPRFGLVEVTAVDGEPFDVYVPGHDFTGALLGEQVVDGLRGLATDLLAAAAWIEAQR